MRVGRIIAWLFLGLGIGLLCWHLIPVIQSSGKFQPWPFAQLWLEIHTSSQLGFSHLLQDWFGTETYSDIFVPYFWNVPAYLVLIVLGAILALIFRRRRGRKF